MQPIYKRVKIIKPHCPKCKEMLSGNGSVTLPYTCSCGKWKYSYEKSSYIKEEIKYTKLPPFLGEGQRLDYKGVVATLFEYDDYALIYTISSENDGKGEVREFIKLLREDYPIIKSSIPLSSKWEMICKKYNIEIK